MSRRTTGDIPFRERYTDGSISKVNYLTAESIASSDLNEAQTLMIRNMINYLYPTASEYKIIPNIILSKDSTKTKLIINRFRYIIYEGRTHMYLGGVQGPIELSNINITEEHKLYMHYRVRDIRHMDKVYRDGIRTNNYTTVSEEEVPNNIYDDILSTEVSTRRAVEFTFTVEVGDTKLSTYDNSVAVGLVRPASEGSDKVEVDILDLEDITGVSTGDNEWGVDSVGSSSGSSGGLVVMKSKDDYIPTKDRKEFSTYFNTTSILDISTGDIEHIRVSPNMGIRKVKDGEI